MWRTPGGPFASPGLEGIASGTRFLLRFPVHAARSLRRDPRGWGRVGAQCVGGVLRLWAELLPSVHPALPPACV